ncbi:MAG: tetraacyldisaccharide 4'-kinase [Candidatus Palauibacterales bacterium]|nr:tetraacyldisaccharide 4'-kinase [Candidatus Palauibacterales bacterium]
MARRLEAHVRNAWVAGPGRSLRLGAAGYATVAGVRNLLYDSGVLASRRAPVPVVSVGGLTIGGSGKTPVTADLAARLSRAGVDTAIVTHGFADEMDVHRRLAPGVRVLGGSDRLRCSRAAAAAGARLVILDSGFQNRRMHRDLDIVTLDAMAQGDRLRFLPAGPYREGLTSLRRAHLVVAVRRDDAQAAREPEAGRSRVRPVIRWLSELAAWPGGPPIVSAWIRPGPLVPVNQAAGAVAEARATVAAAAIMWPEAFFAQARRACPTVEHTVALPDHARFDRRTVRRLRALAGGFGIVCTLKDAGKLAASLPDDVPLWYLSEHVAWQEDGPEPLPVRAAMALLTGELS